MLRLLCLALLLLVCSGAPGRRELVTLPHGRIMFKTVRDTDWDPGLIRISCTYVNRGLEWLNVPKLLRDTCTFCELPDVDNIQISYTHLPSLSDILYSPRAVFTGFSVDDLLASALHPCACFHSDYDRYRDVRTLSEYTHGAPAHTAHVRTMDLNILPNYRLRSEMTGGLGHIPLEPTDWPPIEDTLRQAWTDVLYQIDPSYVLDELLMAGADHLVLIAYDAYAFHHSRNTKHFCCSTPSLFTVPSVLAAVDSLAHFGHWSGVDKAAATWMFRCTKHDRLQAFFRLCGPEFRCAVNPTTLLYYTPEDVVFDVILVSLAQHLPTMTSVYPRLPYLFGTYKMHKCGFRWLTNAHNCIFSEPAMIVQIATEAALTVLKEVSGQDSEDLYTRTGIRTCFFPAVMSMYEVLLNYPETIHSLFTADVCKCYEAIPIDDSAHSLQTPVRWVFDLAFRHTAHRLGLCEEDEPPLLCVAWSHARFKPIKAEWHIECPSDTEHTHWIPFTQESIVALSIWLMTHCYLVLGDRVWIQRLGIAMGFSCSPAWCILYLAYYEYTFIHRLIRLQFYHLLHFFAHWFRYIDDLHWVNGAPYQLFMNPSAACTDDNPYWIYPLHILNIKPEVLDWLHSATGEWKPGIKCNYLNFTLTVLDHETGSFSLTRYVKRRELPFPTTQYLLFHSNRPVRLVYGVVSSQLVPILYVHSTAASASIELRELVHILVDRKGFPMWKVRSLISQALKRDSNYPGLLYDVADMSVL